MYMHMHMSNSNTSQATVTGFLLGKLAHHINENKQPIGENETAIILHALGEVRDHIRVHVHVHKESYMYIQTY